jgi:hypothetical protein
VNIPRRPQLPGGAWARTQEVIYRRTVVLAVGRETYACSVVSSTRGGRIMAERRSLTFGPFRLDLLQSRPARLSRARRPGRVAGRDPQWVLPVSACTLSPGTGHMTGRAAASAGAPPHRGAPGGTGLWIADAHDCHAAGVPFCARAPSPAGCAVSAPGGGVGPALQSVSAAQAQGHHRGTCRRH